MKAVQVVGYHRPLELVDLPEPTVEDPHDVIVKIGGAGVCRTDIHILEGQWARRPRPGSTRVHRPGAGTPSARRGRAIICFITAETCVLSRSQTRTIGARSS